MIAALWLAGGFIFFARCIWKLAHQFSITKVESATDQKVVAFRYRGRNS